MLNYVTLEISNKKIATQVFNHKEERFKSISVLFLVLQVLAFIFHMISLFKSKGHPMLALSSGLNLINLCLVFYFRFKSDFKKMTYMSVPYLLAHTIIAVCVWYGKLAPGLHSEQKEIFTYHILFNYLMVNAIPLTNVKQTVFCMVPILLIGTYLQALAQAKMQ